MTGRRRRVVAALVLAASLLGPACQQSSGGVSAGELADVAASVTREPRRFRVELEHGGQQVEIEGLVEDDHRYQATVTVDGTLAWEEVVDDDHRYLRVGSGRAFPAEVAAAAAEVHPAWSTILAGGWVVDAAGAPAEFPSGRLPVIPYGSQLVLQQVRWLEHAGELLRLPFREYNRQAIYYLPKDDKFPQHEEDGKRFDLVPGAYDPTAPAVRLSEMHRYFTYVSAWAEPGRVNRVEMLTELPDVGDDTYEELYRQVRQAGSQRLVRLVDSAGGDGAVLRESRTWSVAADLAITVPAGAAEVPLREAVAAMGQRIGAAPFPTPLFGPIE